MRDKLKFKLTPNTAKEFNCILTKLSRRLDERKDFSNIIIIRRRRRRRSKRRRRRSNSGKT
jgi:hypothetical protein